ncbi:flagellar biosynthetic protein FliO [Pantoea dispersa]|uniref:flagellar biosynthetic protein FliO n=1 Tax=Pantoea dispersa TaxID=59814 RepID=UPI001EE718FC|nr:flagellar biosynthetic protein FliO [Pantoea dispersa]UKY38136.1 flagellar biosynthetic protein FliO [Pantoea dispersa]
MNASEPLAGDLIMQVGGTLALIVLLIICAGWILRRSGALRRLPQASATLQITERHTVGQRERLLVVEMHDRQLLIGVSAGQISCLASFDKPQAEVQPSRTAADFRSTLGDLLKGRKA